MALSTLNHLFPLFMGGYVNSGLILMQDDASGHLAEETQVDLNERGIYPLF
jgi:hypothetical protein